MAQTPDPDLIHDVITVGGTPGSPDGQVAPLPAQDVAVQVDPLREYIAGGQLDWFVNRPKALPWSIDDLEADLGDDVYTKMCLDAQVSSVLSTLKTSVIEDGVSLTSAIEDEDDPDADLAAEITDFCTKVLDDLATPLDDVLWDMLDALHLGSKVAELVYRHQDVDGTPRLVLHSIKPKPRESTSFVVDTFNTLLGLLAKIPGQPAPAMAGTYVDVAAQPNFIAREKCAVLTFRPRNNDPRGTSILRPAYKPWWSKQEAQASYLKYLQQFASPSVIGQPAENARPALMKDARGQVITDSTGQPLMHTPVEILDAAIARFQGGTRLTIPAGASAQLLEQKGDGRAYADALDRYDRAISKAVVLQTLASDEGRHNARAAAVVHQDLLDTLIRQIKRLVVRMLRRDVLRPLVLYNWGPSALHLVPQASLGNTEQQDFSLAATAIAALATSGYLDSSQQPGIDRFLNLPERTPGGTTVGPDDTGPEPQGGTPGARDEGAAAMPQETP